MMTSTIPVLEKLVSQEEYSFSLKNRSSIAFSKALENVIVSFNIHDCEGNFTAIAIMSSI